MAPLICFSTATTTKALVTMVNNQRRTAGRIWKFWSKSNALFNCGRPSTPCPSDSKMQTLWPNLFPNLTKSQHGRKEYNASPPFRLESSGKNYTQIEVDCDKIRDSMVDGSFFFSGFMIGCLYGALIYETSRPFLS